MGRYPTRERVIEVVKRLIRDHWTVLPGLDTLELSGLAFVPHVKSIAEVDEAGCAIKLPSQDVQEMFNMSRKARMLACGGKT